MSFDELVQLTECICGSDLPFERCCFFTTALLGADRNSGLTCVFVAGQEIYIPSKEREAEVNALAAAQLRGNFSPGIYKKKPEVERVSKALVNFYGSLSDKSLPFLANESTLLWLLMEYEKSSILEEFFKKGELVSAAKQFWLETGAFHRRTLSYLLERVAISADPTALQTISQSTSLVKVLDEAYIACKMLILFCIACDENRLPTAKLQLQITEPGESSFLVISGDNPLDIRSFERRVDFHREAGYQFYGDNHFENDFVSHGQILDKPLKNSLGFAYTEAIGILSVMQADEVFSGHVFKGTCMVPEMAVFEYLSKTFGLPISIVRKIISGFWLTRKDLESEGRAYWNAKLHYRTHSRGIFRIESSAGANLIWSRAMFSEAYVFLIKGTSYGHFPKEWLSDDVKVALGILAVKKGAWFEEFVASSLRAIGIAGVFSRCRIGIGKYALPIEAGEIDYLGWSETDSALVLLECKMIQGGAEARTWKNQINAFINGEPGADSFVSKLAKKQDFVERNVSRLIDALRSEQITVKTPVRRLLTAFVTFEPSVVSPLIEAFPCISLPELIREYRAEGKWTYSQGVTILDEVTGA